MAEMQARRTARRTARQERRAERGGLLGGLLGGNDNEPAGGTEGGALTDPSTVTRLPDPDDPRIKEMLRERLRRRRLSSGRLSTIMSDRTRSVAGY